MVLSVPTDISEQIKFVDLTEIDVFSKLEQLFERKYYAKGFSFLLCKLKNGKEFKYHPLTYIHKIRDENIFILLNISIFIVKEKTMKRITNIRTTVFIYIIT
jgi:disulfide oxidoreductase YuzD